MGQAVSLRRTVQSACPGEAKRQNHSPKEDDLNPAMMRPWTRIRRFLGRSYMMFYGLLLSVMAAQDLLSTHRPHPRWLDVLVTAASVFFMVWMIVVLWVPQDECKPTLFREDKLTFGVAVCVGLVVWLIRIPFSVFLVGTAFGLLFLGVGWIRRRAYYAAALGWCLAGIAVATLSTSLAEPDRQSLLLFLGGLATALQGVWDLVRDFRPAELSPEAT